MTDLLFRGALVYDGSGAPGRLQDVAVRGGRIVAVGPEASALGGRVVHAAGLALAPGFIDLHSLADATLPSFPRAMNSIAQGVTTEFVGLCGFSVAPVSPTPARGSHLHELIRGIGPDLDWRWQSFGSYPEVIDAVHQG